MLPYCHETHTCNKLLKDLQEGIHMCTRHQVQLVLHGKHKATAGFQGPMTGSSYPPSNSHYDNLSQIFPTPITNHNSHIVLVGEKIPKSSASIVVYACHSPNPIVFDSIQINSVPFSVSNTALAGSIRSDEKTHKLPRKKQVTPNASVPPLVDFFPHAKINKIYHQPRNTSQNQPTPRSRLLTSNTARPTVPQTHNDRAEFATWEGKYSFRIPFDASPELLSLPGRGKKEREQKG